jgi:glutathione S-transferase
MRIYYLPGSPYARVVRIAALELNAPCETIEETEFPPKLVEPFNPARQVPTLVDDNHTLFGTRLIVDYLMTEYRRTDTTNPIPFATEPTRPSQHWRDAQILIALEAMLNSLVARSYLIWTGAEHRSKAAIPLDLKKHELDRVYRLLDWLEREASPNGFLPGVFSLQDVWLISAIGWTEARIPIEWRGRPNLETTVGRCGSRESVLATVPSAWHPEA